MVAAIFGCPLQGRWLLPRITRLELWTILLPLPILADTPHQPQTIQASFARLACRQTQAGLQTGGEKAAVAAASSMRSRQTDHIGQLVHRVTDEGHFAHAVASLITVLIHRSAIASGSGLRS